MSDGHFHALVRQCFETSPGPAADEAAWLVVDDPILLASFEQQRAIERFWFGVQRLESGQVLVMDVCFEQYHHVSTQE